MPAWVWRERAQENGMAEWYQNPFVRRQWRAVKGTVTAIGCYARFTETGSSFFSFAVSACVGRANTLLHVFDSCDHP